MPTSLLYLISTFLVCWALISCDSGTDGLDTTFGSTGVVTTAIGSSDDRAYALTIQTDGKIVVGGGVFSTSFQLGLVRYATDGTLDTSFSGDGKSTTSISSGEDLILSLEKQSDGKIIACGHSTPTSNNTDLIVARFLANGSLDTTFATNGVFSLDFGALGNDGCESVALDSQGRILAAGFGHNGTDEDVAIIRLLSSGGLDSTFDSDGKLLANFSTGSADRAFKLSLDGQNRINVVGQSATRSLVARFLSNGSLDTDFAILGSLSTSFSGATDLARGLSITASGNLVVAGTTNVGSSSNFLVFRLDPSGALDSVFASGGFASESVSTSGTSDLVYDLTASGTQLLLAGSYYNGSNFDFTFARMRAVGTLDAIFASNGFYTYDAGGGLDEARSIGVQADGKIVAAGYFHNGSNHDFGVVRYNP